MGLKHFRNREKKSAGFLRRIGAVPVILKKHLPWKSGAPEHLSLRLELNRRILYEINDPSPSDTITIGRSSDCVWVIPREDNVASGHHAVILMRKGRLCLRDTGSRNGIFYKGRKIQEKNLAPEDQFSIGNCTLYVERVKPIRKARHELVYLNTEQKGKSVVLDRPRFVIGSAPSCDLVIDEQLVSQRHAEFATKADGCWLKDLCSKNGTFVNGTKLSSNTERLLVDDDVVSISFVDFKFVDGKVEHSKVRIWYSLGVVAVTIFVVLALNWLWMGMQGSSDSCLNRARREAAAGRFAEAREALKESRTRRGADANLIVYQELERSVAIWENIFDGWKKARSALSFGNWVEASRILGRITDADPNVWGWNDTSALEMRKEAFAVKQLLDACLRAGASMRDDRNGKNLAELKQAASVINRMEKQFRKNPPAYLKKLLSEAQTIHAQINRNLHYLERLEAILARIELEADNLTLVLGDLEELKTQAEPGIRVRIENCMVPLAMLQRAGKQLRSAMIAVQQLDFSRLEKIRLDLPTLEQCVVNENIATLRKRQERVFNQVLDTAASLRPLIDTLRKAGLDENAALPECVTVFLDPKVMAKVFACDALDRAMPSRLRSEPSGEYDRVLGIEGFFEFIYALPAPYDQSIYAEFQFQPEIVKFRTLLSAIRTFRMFSDQKENEWLHAGAFQRLYDKTGEILAVRDRIAGEYSGAQHAQLRGKILANAIVIFLAEGKSSEEKLEAFSHDVKNLRQPIIRLVRDYNSAVPEEKIRIRDTILKQGIPGDPVVRRMWGFKKYSR